MNRPVAAGALLLPKEIAWSGDRPVVGMVRVDAAALALPFWEDIVRGAGPVVALLGLDSVALDDRELRIAGAIHHMTRCGSTLVLRQFDALDRVAVASEPFVFQMLLEGPPASPEVSVHRIRQLAALMRDGLAPVGDHIVVKWPALLGRHADVLAAALPEVPTIFLHRAPTEVLASIKRAPLGAIAQASDRFLAPAGEAPPRAPRTLLEKTAMMLAASITAVARAPHVRHVDYAQLPEASSGAIADWFGFDLTPSQKTRMQGAARWSAKVPGEAFASRPDRTVPSDGEVAELAATVLAPALAYTLAALQPL